MLDDGVKVISNRTLDNKTIKLTDDKTAIEVKVSQDDDNAVKVSEDGIYVPRRGFYKQIYRVSLSEG